MRKLKYANLIMCITFGVIMFSHSSKAQDKFGLSASQKHFTAIIRTLPGVVYTEWRSPVSLYVKTNSRAVGSPPNVKIAQKLAETLAERGRTALRQPFCVHIYHKKNTRLARSCVH